MSGLSPRVFMPRTIAKVLSLSHKNPMRYPDIFNVWIFLSSRKTQDTGIYRYLCTRKVRRIREFLQVRTTKTTIRASDGRSRGQFTKPFAATRSLLCHTPRDSPVRRNLRDRIIFHHDVTRGSCACSRLIASWSRSVATGTNKSRAGQRKDAHPGVGLPALHRKSQSDVGGRLLPSGDGGGDRYPSARPRNRAACGCRSLSGG